MGGVLSVQSEPGQGSTFTLELELGRTAPERPATPEPVRSLGDPARQPDDPQPAHNRVVERAAIRVVEWTANGVAKREHALRILVAEDYEANRIVVEQLLKLLGCAVDSVANGRQAVEAMSRGRYDLVLMDVQMPEMDGLAATVAIRTMEAPVGRHTPILAYTAHSMEEDHRRCLEAGMDDVLIKPVRVNDLSGALARWSRPVARGHLAHNGPSPPQRPLEGHCGTWVDRLLKRCLGDRRLAHEVLRALLNSVQEPISGLDEGLAAGDAERLRNSANSLKGLLLAIGAEEEAVTCRELEQAAGHSDLERARELTGTVQHRWFSLESSIQVYLQSTG
jgi:CheY-like chemotaxis protein